MAGNYKLSIASALNSILLLCVLFSFPLVLKWSGAFTFVTVASGSPQHTQEFLRFCFIVLVFEWTCFFIALAGIKRRGAVTLIQLVGVRWNANVQTIRDLGVAFLALLAMIGVNALLQQVLSPFQSNGASFRAMLPQNRIEAVGFIALGVTAGFVEEFVFRGYLQVQCTAFTGSTIIGSILQILLFTVGHTYQGWARLIPVALTGVILTAVALWRKSLGPGILSHALGDSLSAILFLCR